MKFRGCFSRFSACAWIKLIFSPVHAIASTQASSFTVEPRFNEVPRDWENWFFESRVRYINLFSIYFTELISLKWRISFVTPRISLYISPLNRGSTVIAFLQWTKQKRVHFSDVKFACESFTFHDFTAICIRPQQTLDWRACKLITLRMVPPIVSAHPFCASHETLPRARPRVSPDAYSMLTSICKKNTPQRAVCWPFYPNSATFIPFLFSKQHQPYW